MLMIDLDGFKAVNDIHGHGTGDALLTAAAERLRARLRTSDLLARLGGDEFAALLPAAGRAEAEHVARVAVEVVRDLSPAAGPPVTASVGAAVIADARAGRGGRAARGRPRDVRGQAGRPRPLRSRLTDDAAGAARIVGPCPRSPAASSAAAPTSIRRRLPPGQYLTRDFPVLSAGPTPKVHLHRWTFSIEGEVDEPALVDLGGAAGAARRGGHGRHPLRDEVDQARHDLEGRLARHAARRRRHRGGVRDGVLRRRLHDEPAARGRHRTARRGSPTSTTASRSSPRTAARPACSCRTCTSGRARSGCAACGSTLEEEPGFWEQGGYHIYGDPWREQRYWGD